MKRKLRFTITKLNQILFRQEEKNNTDRVAYGTLIYL